MALTATEEAELQTQIGFHMNEILRLFKPGAKITVVVTNDAYGDAGVLVTNDDPSRAIEEIRRRVPPACPKCGTLMKLASGREHYHDLKVPHWRCELWIGSGVCGATRPLEQR